MTDDYECKVCGRQFEEEEDLKSHGKDDHPEVNEAYPEVFQANEGEYGIGGRPKNEDDRAEDLHDQFDEQDIFHVDELVDQGTDRTDAITKVAKDAGYEIDQQEDKPVQSHDDWQKELEGLQDEFATEQDKCAICNGEHPTSEHPVLEAIDDSNKYPEDSEGHVDSEGNTIWEEDRVNEGGTGSGPQEGSKPSLLPEQVARAGDPHYNPFKATSPSERLQTDPALSRTTEEAPEDELVWNGEHYVKAKEQEEEEWNKANPEEKKDILDKSDTYQHNPEEKSWDELHPDVKQEIGEDGGADDPLKKVADLSENYKYMSRDNRISLFESVKFTQGDSAILSGLEWNELTRPIKVEVSEAYIKEQEEPEVLLDPEEEEEDKAYEVLYNIEKYHDSADFKKKSLVCNRCNEAFYNTNDRNIHFNDVHAEEDEYKLPETCPYCNIEINEPDNLDWHMQEEHGAHVPSQYTQTGLQGAMADTDFDSLESHKRASEEFKKYFYDDLPPEIKEEYTNLYGDTSNWVILPDSMEQKLKSITGESYARERSEYFINSFTAPSQRVGNFDTYWRCHICGADVDGEELEQHYDQHEDAGDIPHFESRKKKANETSIYGSVIDDHFDEQYVMDQDGMYKCEHCGAWLDVHNIGSFSPEEVAKHHLETEHGITESRESHAKERMVDVDDYGVHYNHFIDPPTEDNDYNYDPREGYKAKEDDTGARVIKPGDPDYEKEMAIQDAWNDLGASIKAQGLSKDELKKRGIVFLESRATEKVCPSCGGSGIEDPETPNELGLSASQPCKTCGGSGETAEESRASDLRKEIKDKTNFINMASFENPMNMGDDQAQLEALKDELESLGGEELESTEEDDSNIHDKRIPAIGGYDPELDEDDPEEERDERKPEIGGYDPELDYDG